MIFYRQVEYNGRGTPASSSISSTAPSPIPPAGTILRRLARGDANVGELAGRFPISFNGVSKHVKVLERAGLVERTVLGREHVLRLRAAPLRDAAEWLAHYRAFWEARLDALDELLTGKRPRRGRTRLIGKDDPDDVVVVRRVIAAPRDRVFAAWLDPAMLARFMRPGDVADARAEIDARVGGAFRITMVHARGETDHRGEYLAIEPPSRLAFTWISENTDRQPTEVTIEFHDRGGETEIVLTHRRLPAARIPPHREGWGDIVEKLDGLLTRPAPRGAGGSSV